MKRFQNALGYVVLVGTLAIIMAVMWVARYANSLLTRKKKKS
ncbi:MAG: hypothetical protein Q7S95_02795 [bacterium]|nr:hypothetical protein [bacterium]